jgi:hypothetical protein
LRRTDAEPEDRMAVIQFIHLEGKPKHLNIAKMLECSTESGRLVRARSGEPRRPGDNLGGGDPASQTRGVRRGGRVP